MIRMTGPGRAEVAPGPAPSAEALTAALDAAFGDGTATSVGWWVPVGDWAARRTAWRLGFQYGGVLRGWVDGQDAWAFTLRADDPREPATRWLECPTIERDGVRLRPFTDADVPRIVEGLGDADTQYWLAFMPRDPDEAAGRRYVEQVTDRLANGTTLNWAWCAADDDRLLGAVGIYRLHEEPELGYWTHPEARGRGLTARAARVAVEHAFDGLGLERLAAYAAAGNKASWRVLERVGMQRVGVRRQAVRITDGTPTDLVCYDLLAEEWRRSREADQASTATPATQSAAPTSAGDR